jgi:TRAP-type uncharacterized transport system fused permease subunit
VAFRLGLAAFIVPYMFVFSPALLMQGSAGVILRAVITAVMGTICFGNAIGGWFLHRANVFIRLLMLVCAFLLIDQGLLTDLIGLGIIALCFVIQKFVFIDTAQKHS